MVDIGSPEYDLKLKILRKKYLNIRTFKESPDLQKKFKAIWQKEQQLNIRELIGIFNRVVAFGKNEQKTFKC